MSTLEAQAAELGIPMQIEVDEDTQYEYCDAFTATLSSIEGKHAYYSGECANRHIYEVKRLVSELQAEHKKRLQVGPSGKLVWGLDEGFKAGELEEL